MAEILLDSDARAADFGLLVKAAARLYQADISRVLISPFSIQGVTGLPVYRARAMTEKGGLGYFFAKIGP